MEEMLGMLNVPREELFKLLGSQDGSGSALLQALAGVDPESDVGRYGGVAAEIAGDPLNLLGLGGALGAGKAIGKIGQLGRAGRVAEASGNLATAGRAAEKEMAAARALEMAEANAAGTFNPGTMGPGGMPLSPSVPRGTMMPELMREQIVSPGRQQAGASLRKLPGNDMYPTQLSGGDAARFQESSRRQLSGAMGEMFPPKGAEQAGMLDDYRYGMLRGNAGQNAERRAFGEFASEAGGGRPMLTVGDLLQGDAGMVGDVAAGNPAMMAAMGGSLDAPASMLKTAGLAEGAASRKSALNRALLEELARLQAPVDPIYGQVAGVGLGGAVGGRAGMQAFGQ